MENILNFRLLAESKRNKEGKKIKNIYRSADVSNASSKDIDFLIEKDILNIIDLRNKEEIKDVISNGNNKFKVFNNIIIDEVRQNDLSLISSNNIYNFMIDLYRNKFVISDGFKNEIKYILTLKGEPFLFHCTAGKDRTGITGALLMYILGFNLKDISEEYLKIDPLLVEFIFNKLKVYFMGISTEDELLKLKSCATVDKRFILEFENGIKSRYGTIDKYIKDKLSISDEEINYLKKIYLED